MEEEFEGYEPTDEELQEIFFYMLENGYIEEIGEDLFGEPIYKMTQKMVVDFPDFLESHMAATNEIVFSLWQKGLIEMNMSNSGDWTVVPIYSTFHYDEIDIELTKEEILLLEEIARVHLEKGFDQV